MSYPLKYSKMEGRFCVKCGSDKTYSHVNGYPKWHRTLGGHMCSKCYNRMKYNKHYHKYRRLVRK